MRFSAHNILTQTRFKNSKNDSRHCDPNPLGPHTLTRIKEIMRHLHIPDIRLEELELESSRCEEGGEREVEFAVSQTISGVAESPCEPS